MDAPLNDPNLAAGAAPPQQKQKQSVDPNAAAMAGPSGFDASRLVQLFQQCNGSVTDIPIPAFIDGCLEIRKIVGVLGSAFGIAANDISQKCGVLNQR